MDNSTLILGIGNRYRKDDGIGVIVIQKLRDDNLTNADLIDGSMDGLTLFEYLKNYNQAIVIDAAHMGVPPGEVKIFSKDEANINIKSDQLSTHGFGLAEVVQLLSAFNIEIKMTIIGVQPLDTSFGEGLTPLIESRVEYITGIIRDLLKQQNPASETSHGCLPFY